MAKPAKPKSEKSVGSLRRPKREEELTIPNDLISRLQSAAEELAVKIHNKSADFSSPSNKAALSIVLEALMKLSNPELACTPELQIQFISRMTGALKDTQLGKLMSLSEVSKKTNALEASSITLFERTTLDSLAHSFVIPFLLDCRVRYLHRGLTSLLRSFFCPSKENFELLETAFIKSIDALCFHEGSVRFLVPCTGLTEETLSQYKSNILIFLNNLDSLSSTLIPLAPHIFSRSFVHVLPLLGDSFRWCVTNATSTERFLTMEARPSGKEVTSAVLGEDLEQIRFCVRMVASFVHKYLDQCATYETSSLCEDLLRLLEPSVLMLSSYRFPKDVLNATGLLLASILTVRQLSTPLLRSMCRCLCVKKEGENTATVSEATHRNAMQTLVHVSCTSSEVQNEEQDSEAVSEDQIDEAVGVIFSKFTTPGKFALLKGLLAHLSSPVRGNVATLGALFEAAPPACPMETKNENGSSILYSLIIPFCQVYYRSVDLPEVRFMAIQTMDCVVRHVTAVLGHVLRLTNEGKTSQKTAPAAETELIVSKLRKECLVVKDLEFLIRLVTQLAMEVWDDSTSQVYGALYDTYSVLLSLNKLASDLFTQFPELQNDASAESSEGHIIHLLDIRGTMLSVLRTQNERRGKYHALLGLLSALPCIECIHCIGIHFLGDSFQWRSGDIHKGIECFCRSLLNGAGNHKIASVAGDTLTKMVEVITKAQSELSSITDKEEKSEKEKMVLDESMQCIFRTLAMSLLQKNYVSTSSNISVATHISLISAHFICPLLKHQKEFLDILLQHIFLVKSELKSEMVEERFLQAVIEVLIRARGAGILIERYLLDSGRTAEVIFRSLQNFKFEQRVAALQLCVVPSKKAELILPWQLQIVERFLALNMHLGGDTAARKTLLDNLEKWYSRIVHSFDAVTSVKQKKKKVVKSENESSKEISASIDVESYANDLIVPHIKNLVYLFVDNIGSTGRICQGLSVERKVVACTCYTSLLKWLKKSQGLLALVQDFLYPPCILEGLVMSLSDGWSLMRSASQALINEFQLYKNGQVLAFYAAQIGDATEEALHSIKTSSTFRMAEGAVHRYVLMKELEITHSDPSSVTSMLRKVLMDSLADLKGMCTTMDTLRAQPLHDFILSHPLHGLFSLCSEVFRKLYGVKGEVINANLRIEEANALLRVCAHGIRTCGVLVGQGANGEENVDCRGHVFDVVHGQSEEIMRHVVNNTWLSIRVATSCIQRTVGLVDIASIEYEMLRDICYTLINALLLTKHNGVMRCVRAALKILVEALVRCRSPQFYHLPGELLSFLLGVNGVSSESTARMLRRSQGLPHAILAVLEAEDSSVPCVLFPIAIRTLLSIAAGGSEAEDEVSLCQQSNALNVLKFIFEDKIFGERVVGHVESAFTIATTGFDHPSWNIRNSALMLFAATLQRFVGEHPSTGGSGINTSFHDLAQRTPKGIGFAYRKLRECGERNGRQVEELALFPVLQMLSMLSPDPPHLAGQLSTGLVEIEDMVRAVRNCGKSKNLMIRVACATALPCLVSPSIVPSLLESIVHDLLRDAKKTPSMNTTHAVLLQLQHFHSSYVGTLSRQKRVARSPYACEKTGSSTVQAVVKSLATAIPCFVQAAVCCPTVCASFLSLLSDLLFYIRAEGPFPIEDDRKADLTLVVSSAVEVLGAVVLKKCWSIREHNGDYAAAMEAAGLFLAFAVHQRSYLTNEARSVLLTVFQKEGNTAERTDLAYKEEVYGLLSWIARHLHTFLKKEHFSDFLVRDVVQSMKNDFQLDLHHYIVSILQQKVGKNENYQSWHLCPQSEVIEFLCDMALIGLKPPEANLSQQLESTLTFFVKQGRCYFGWCSAVLRYLCISAQKSCSTSSSLFDAVEFFSLPQHPQTMRLAVLDALFFLVPVLRIREHTDDSSEADFSLSLSLGSTSEGSLSPTPKLLISILHFLLDDSYDVREKAAALCCTALFGERQSMIADAVTCSLWVVLALRRFSQKCPLQRDDLHDRFFSICEAPTDPNEAEEDDDVLFRKENDNMFAEESLLYFFEDIIFSSDLSHLEASFGFRCMSEILSKCEEEGTLRPTIATFPWKRA